MLFVICTCYHLQIRNLFYLKKMHSFSAMWKYTKQNIFHYKLYYMINPMMNIKEGMFADVNYNTMYLPPKI